MIHVTSENTSEDDEQQTQEHRLPDLAQRNVPMNLSSNKIMDRFRSDQVPTVEGD